MKTIVVAVMALLLTGTAARAESCAVEKRAEYEALAEKLYAVDPEEAFGAKEAYRIVGMFEAVAPPEERCRKMDRLLEDMRDAIEAAQ
ncbi:MAG: hypothetical protein PUB01_05220 [Desulfovibrionaceae bacterium]|nr:hypothetical protein [Desulfovibrionaceae bacterium]